MVVLSNLPAPNCSLISVVPPIYVFVVQKKPVGRQRSTSTKGKACTLFVNNLLMHICFCLNQRPGSQASLGRSWHGLASRLIHTTHRTHTTDSTEAEENPEAS